MQTQLREILRFLKDPNIFLTKKSDIPPTKGLLYAIANKLGMYFIFIIALGVVSLAIKAGTGFNLFALFTDGRADVNDLRREYFMALIYAPVVEELLFRSVLGLTRLGFWLSVSFISMLVFPVLLRFVPDDPALYLLFLYLLCYVLLALVLSKILGRQTDTLIEKYLRPNFRWLVYASIVGFGFMHLSNFQQLTVWHIVLVPILTFPQLIGGVFMSFVRVNYGLSYAMALHALGNAYPVLMRLMSKNGYTHYLLLVMILVGYSIYKLWRYSKGPKIVGG
ncbi:MAG: hypothetical protein KKG00_04280 [Bacteroidetes bacterium]|nr:hypothetical protein [Bacteroidota bacterium]